MGSITSGIGLVSGIDIQGLVDRLIAVEARPRDQLLARVGNLDAQRTAFLDISARITALLTNVRTLTKLSSFNAAKAASSNSDVLGVSVGENASPGSYRFRVLSLASTHQVISNGFRSRTAALNPGTLTIESSKGRVNPTTTLAELNGLRGVSRGSFSITDAAGHEAKISTTDITTVSDLLDRINDAGIDVAARIEGDAIKLTETTGGQVRVREVNGGKVAADLGFGLGNQLGAGSLTGSDVLYLDQDVDLARLNDGRGLRTNVAGGDFTISGAGFAGFDVALNATLTTDTRLERLNRGEGVDLGTIRVTKGGEVYDVDLSSATTIGEVKDQLEAAVPGLVVTLASSRLNLSTTGDTDEAKALKIEDLNGGTTAADLGIVGDADDGSIRGGDLLHFETLADVVSAINYASGNDGAVTARIEGTRIVLDGAGDFTLAAANGSHALADLGLAEGDYTAAEGARSNRLIAGMDSVLLRSLNGGKGYELGTIQIDANGQSATVDLTGAESLRDVIDRINDAAEANNLGIEAAYDGSGTRFALRNLSSGDAVSVSDITGTFAAQTGINRSATELRSDNLQRQYIATNTALSSLNDGAGVRLGTIKITNSLGASKQIDFGSGTYSSLNDIIKRINEESEFGISARINDTGDGLLIEDSTNGGETFKIEDVSGTTARDLNLTRTASDGKIDGSFELNITVEAGDTLSSLVTRINDQKSLANASIFSDGSAGSPFRLSLTSRKTGEAGELLIDGSSLGLDFSTLSSARDAKVALGEDDANGVLITSSSNTITDAVPGLTLDLLAANENPVTVTVSEDLGSLVSSISGLVKSFNDVLDRIKTLSGYNAETETGGVLLGDSSVRAVESRLLRLITGTVSGAPGGIRRLSEVGIRLSEGKLTFDETKFRDAYAADPQGVTSFFTDETNGIAKKMESEIERLTDDSTGLLPAREKALENQKTLLNDRVDVLNDRLLRRRDQLLRQFLSMEQALSSLQSQQTALSQLSALSSSYSTGGSGG